VIANGGLLNGKTRVVALNSTTFLQHFDLIVCLKGGKIIYSGPYSGLCNESSNEREEKVVKEDLPVLNEKTFLTSVHPASGRVPLLSNIYIQHLHLHLHPQLQHLHFQLEYLTFTIYIYIPSLNI
jgi:ABC-type multidrug transport system ATPase subunit